MALVAPPISSVSQRGVWQARLRVSAIIRFLTVLYLLSEAVSGALRYSLNLLGVYWAIYLPKALLVGALAFAIRSGGRVSAVGATVALFVAISMAWGTLNFGSASQAAFGFWVISPAVFAAFFARHFMEKPECMTAPFVWIFGVCVLGVLSNQFVAFPWVGQEVELAGKAIEVSREWTTYGIPRYPGFSNNSINTASILLISIVWIAATSSSRLLIITVWLLGGWGIWVSTSKGPAVSYLVLTLYFIGIAGGSRSLVLLRFWIAVLWALLATMIVVPLSTLFWGYALALDSVAEQFLWGSFGERLSSTWPESFRLLGSDWRWLVGIGIGGFGSAQVHFDPTNRWTGDNLFVFLTVNVGLPMALAVLSMVAFGLGKWARSKNYRLLYLPLGLALFSYGVVSNIIDGTGSLSLVLGALISCAWRGPAQQVEIK